MMKYLLLLAIVLLVVWVLRKPRRKVEAPQSSAPPASQPTLQPTEIVECARCHVHLPRTDAVLGRRGLHYCGAAHQREAEGG